jgi:hypothetical protein
MFQPEKYIPPELDIPLVRGLFYAAAVKDTFDEWAENHPVAEATIMIGLAVRGMYVPGELPLAVVEPGKLDYLFGRVASNQHNLERSLQNLAQLRRLGHFDTPGDRAIIQRYLQRLVRDPSNITQTYVNEYGTFVVRQSLYIGPSGAAAMFESTWQLVGGQYRLTTVIPVGGR